MLITAAFVIAACAGAPQVLQSDAGDSPSPPARTFPAPRNLKVLPKNMTGQQVHDIMQQWSGELGTRCDACHAKDPDGVVPAGPAPPKFVDDSKPMKDIARLMYTMTEQINNNFIAKVEGSGLPVTCGTCHHGRISPEPFAPPAEPSSTQAPLQKQSLSR